MLGVTGWLRSQAISDDTLRPKIGPAYDANQRGVGGSVRGAHTHMSRIVVEPQYDPNKETWDQYQKRHCEWSTGSACRTPPKDEGKSPPQTPGEILFGVLLSILGGLGDEGGGRPGEAPVGTRPGSPMETSSPAPSRPGSPMDTSSPPPPRPDSPMDTSPSSDPGEAGKGSKSSDETRQPNQDLKPDAVPHGMHVNEMGMLEKESFTTVYRVDSGLNRDAIHDHGFEPSTHFGGVGKMISGKALIVSETMEGARAFGDSEFGAGHYDLYAIDASGLKGASLKDNVDYNTTFTAKQLGRTPEALKTMKDREIAEGALEFREAHIDATAGCPDKIHLIERGVPRPQTPSDSDSSTALA
jgi:hypothetical protein